MKNTLFILLLFLLSPSFAQNTTNISGYIKDEASGEFLEGAIIQVKDKPSIAVEANDYGYYSLNLEKGDYNLIVTYIGYQSKTIAISLLQPTKKDFLLKEKTTNITTEVQVTDKRENKNVKSTDIGKIELKMSEIKALPVIFGEVDIIKTIQLLPGVKTAVEGNTGFYVRGGAADQNLILLDEAVVYNPGHSLGFFSVFNGDAIKGMEFYKGYIPANYGNRLSSVLDISMKEGNNKKYTVEGGIGLIASRLTVQGPIQNGKSSFMVSGRRTYVDILARPFLKGNKSKYYFYDLNAKANYTFSDRDRLFVSGYFGRDVVKVGFGDASAFSFNNGWGNATVTARWNHTFTPDLFLNTSLIFSDYNFSNSTSVSSIGLSVKANIRNYSSKFDFSYYGTPSHTIKFGYHYTRYIFTPVTIQASLDTISLGLNKVQKKFANENALYINGDYDITTNLRFSYGARFSMFQHVGPYTYYTENSTGNQTDSVVYTKGKPLKTFLGFEPRFSIRYTLDSVSSIKAAYVKTNQYVHLTAFGSLTLPTDIWLPSSIYAKPQIGHQICAGYFRNFNDNTLEASIEGYYKKMFNQIEYKDGTSLLDQNLDQKLVFGTGQAYGTELFLRKTAGKLTGWVGYTLSWTTRKFADLNFGKPFYAKYDRRHDISIVANYEIAKKLTISGVFVYGTGNATTVPSYRALYNQDLVSVYQERNGYRLPAYHRMDISLTYFRKRTEKVESSWNLSIYNVYSRRNPFAFIINTTGGITDGSLKTEATKVSLFGMVPSITYNFKF